MISLPRSVRIFLARQPISMHHSFDALAAAVQAQLGQDPLAGHLFVFLNKRRTHLKILFFERDGYCILYRRLERGTFQLPTTDTIELEPADLALILGGIDLNSARRRPRYRHPNTYEKNPSS
jgi:transposase